MSVITFVNNIPGEQSGKTLSLVAIATSMAINKNNKILVISTTNKRDRIRDCYFEEESVKKRRFGIFAENKSSIENEDGIEGIAKMARSNKLTPEMITNYTKVVFKDRLEVILARQKKEEKDNNDLVIDEKEIEHEYYDLINVAAMYYDKVFVDLDDNLSEEIKNKIIQRSELVVVNTSQNLKSIKELKKKKEQSELLKSAKTLILVGRYDNYSKYNSKNITRFLEEKNQVLTIPYNTRYFEASNEAAVQDFFIDYKRDITSDDPSVIFNKEVERAVDNIIYRLQELQTII